MMRETNGKTKSDQFIGLKINYLVGQLLFLARLNAGISLNAAAREIDTTIDELRSIERGSRSIPLCDLSILIGLYGMTVREAESFVNELPSEVNRHWAIDEFAAIAVHRLRVDHGIQMPSATSSLH
jgi:transcriptional regulator with XRE-family HTH domain